MPFLIFSCLLLIVVQLAAANVNSHSCNSCLLSSLSSVCLDFVMSLCLLARLTVSCSPPTFTPLTWVWFHHYCHLFFLSQSTCSAGTMLMFIDMLSPSLDFSSSDLHRQVHPGSSINSSTTLDITSFMHRSCWEIQCSVIGLNVFTGHLQLHWPPDLTVYGPSRKFQGIVPVTAPSTCIHTAGWNWSGLTELQNKLGISHVINSTWQHMSSLLLC